MPDVTSEIRTMNLFLLGLLCERVVWLQVKRATDVVLDHFHLGKTTGNCFSLAALASANGSTYLPNGVVFVSGTQSLRKTFIHVLASYLKIGIFFLFQ